LVLLLLATPGGSVSWTGLLWSLMGIGFHAGVFAIQGLDFISFWGTIFLVHFVGLQSGGGIAITHLEEVGYHAKSTTIYDILDFSACKAIVFGAGTAAGGADEAESLLPGQPLFLLALLYSLFQLYTALTLRDIRPGCHEILPLTCCPMFIAPRNIYDSRVPILWGLVDFVFERKNGVIEPLLYSPISTVYKISETQMQALPYKFLSVTDCSQIPDAIRSKIVSDDELARFAAALVVANPRTKPTAGHAQMLCFANFDISDKLHGLLLLIFNEIRGPVSLHQPVIGDEAAERARVGEMEAHLAKAWDSASLHRLWDLQAQCRAEFDAIPFTPPTDRKSE